MEIVELSYRQLARNRGALLKFIRAYGEKRITATAMRWFQSATEADLAESPGTQILVYREQGRIAGLSAMVRHGLDHSIAVIHPRVRGQGIAKRLVDHHISTLGKIYVRVAVDNIPSMKVCFGNDMIAVRLVTGPTGKPTLIFAGGNWDYADIDKN